MQNPYVLLIFFAYLSGMAPMPDRTDLNAISRTCKISCANRARRPSLVQGAAARELAWRANCKAEGVLGLTVPGTDMNTPNWMMVTTADAPQRAKSARHKRRATDRQGVTVNLALAFAAMVATMLGIYVVNALMLHRRRGHRRALSLLNPAPDGRVWASCEAARPFPGSIRTDPVDGRRTDRKGSSASTKTP